MDTPLSVFCLVSFGLFLPLIGFAFGMIYQARRLCKAGIINIIDGRYILPRDGFGDTNDTK